MTFSERAKSAVRAIVSVFETGKADGDYSAVAVLADGAGISYGAHQATHRSGSLALVVVEYLKAVPDSPLSAYLPELRDKSNGSIERTSRNQTLKAGLRQAGRSAEMKAAQNVVFDKKYMQPAISAAEGSGFKHPLTLAVIYDSKIQGSYDRVRDRVPAGLTEQVWAKRFIAERRSFLANNRKSIVRGTVYRPDALSKLAEAGNWNLNTPFTVRGVRVTTEIVGHADESESFVPDAPSVDVAEPGAMAPGSEPQPAQPSVAVEHADTVTAAQPPVKGGAAADPAQPVEQVKPSLASRVAAGTAAILTPLSAAGITLGSVKISVGVVYGLIALTIVGLVIGAWIYNRSQDRAARLTELQLLNRARPQEINVALKQE